ncbi:hypothetical protein BTM467_14830 [Helicobacter pylori]
MLYPFLKIPLHYSASDRARKVRNKNLKSALRSQQKISKKSAKRKRSKPPPQKRENLKKREFKKKRV